MKNYNSGKMKNYIAMDIWIARQTSLSLGQLCRSARANMLATVFSSALARSLPSQMCFSLSTPYRSAATSRRCTVAASQPSPSPGRESV